MIINGTTSTGLAFAVDDAITGDVRFLRALRKIYRAQQTSDEALAIDGVTEMQMLFFPEGSEGEAALFEHVRTEAGFIPNEAVNNEIREIIEIIGGEAEVKK